MIEWSKEPEKKAYLMEIIPGRSMSEIKAVFYERFNIMLTTGQIKSFKSWNNIYSGTIGGRFVKGQPSHNKGKKMSSEQYAKCKDSFFQPGHVPANHKPVGSERINKDGYWEIKVKEPRTWQLKQRYLWEQHYGEKLTSNDAIIFKDRNPLNCVISNLMKISRAELVRYNAEPLKSCNPEINETLVNIAKIKTKMFKKLREKNDEKHDNQGSEGVC